MQIYRAQTRLLTATLAIFLLNSINTMAQEEKANSATPPAVIEKPQWTAEQKSIVDL